MENREDREQRPPDVVPLRERRWLAALSPWMVPLGIMVAFVVGMRVWQNTHLLSADGDVRAPDVRLTDLVGARLSLSDFRGQTVLLHLWATW